VLVEEMMYLIVEITGFTLSLVQELLQLILLKLAHQE
tara:strand:+ start:119 stop:229 length:111 start_codon:yes stop_codon:yes gene_type:complete